MKQAIQLIIMILFTILLIATVLFEIYVIIEMFKIGVIEGVIGLIMIWIIDYIFYGLILTL